MGLKNYHTHTYRCYHAAGSEEDYIKSAIAAGFEEIGISDHTPWKYDSDFVASMRMPLSSLDDYLNTLQQLKEKYKNQISIKIGLECEYFERYMPWLKNTLKDKKIDYIILGNHYMDTDEKHIYFGSPVSRKQLTAYVDHCICAIDSGLYSYIAHPDLVYYDTQSEAYQQEMSRLCQYAKDHHMPLEFNLLGYKNRRHYPHPDFWNIASQYHNDVIIGYDAHHPDSLKDRLLFDQAYHYLETLDVHIIDRISFLTDKQK